MPDPQTFRTTLLLARKTATGIEVPPHIVESFGACKRVPVQVTINGHAYASTIASMGGVYLIPVSAEHREAAGITAGDEVEVTLVHDLAPRVIEPPADLALALASSPDAESFFASLSNSHRRSYVDWISSAKQDETRARRIVQAVEMLASGRKQR
ncbi:hypothetical protein BH09ACT10_BH09ACT10_05310 [soil metagenome]